MIIDSHAHLFPESVKANRSDFFDNEPEFKLLYNSPRAKISTVSQLIESMEIHGVDRSVVCGFPWRNPDLARINNDYILESVQAHPNRLKGLACFDLAWAGAADEAVRCLDAGLSGVGELAFYLSGIDETALTLLDPVMAALRDHGNPPVMIHTNEPLGHAYTGKTPVTLEQIDALARRFPANRIILAHWGGGIFFYHVMKKQLKTTLKNIWYDTAASIFLYDPAIYDMAKAAGVIDKVLFGTDFPLVSPDRYYADLDKTALTKTQKNRVLGENAIGLYG